MADKYCSRCGEMLAPTVDMCPHCGEKVKKSNCLLIILIAAGVGFVMLIILGMLAAIMIPNFLRAKNQGQFTACQSNLRNIATACEMYSTDNMGHYPASLSEITPMYLKTMPVCPTCEADTYSAGYQSLQDPDVFTVFCGGDHHITLTNEPDYPRYNSKEGLIASPAGGVKY